MSSTLKTFFLLLLASKHLSTVFSNRKTSFLQAVNTYRMAGQCLSTDASSIDPFANSHVESEAGRTIKNDHLEPAILDANPLPGVESTTTDCPSSSIEADDSSILGALQTLPNPNTSASCPSAFSPKTGGNMQPPPTSQSDPKQLEESATATHSPPKVWQKRVRPNAFISVRIPSIEIKQALESVQEGLVKYDRDMAHVVTSLGKLHLTLTVFKLSDDTDIERAKAILEKVTKRVAEDFNLSSDPLSLSFKGLGAFGRDVLFAKVEEGRSKERLIGIVDAVRSEFTSDIFEGIDNRSFNPHVTVAKMSKMPPRIVRRHKSRTGRKKGIDKKSYSEFQDVDFGSQVIEGLELLSMELPADDQGYYHCFQRNQFI